MTAPLRFAVIGSPVAHSDDPVPLLISSGGLEPEGALQFGESEAARGRLGRIRGPQLVPMLVELAKR